jgi:broad specificity phosphatase PhoE
VGERLKDKDISTVYCGPAKRTVQSAEILGSLFNIPRTSLQELDEINIPHWDGLTKDEIRQQYNEQYPTWLNNPETFILPGCETLKQVQERAVEAVESLLAQNESKSLLLVSHLIVLRCLVLYYQGFDIKDFRSIKIDNGSIIYLSDDAEGRRLISPI